MLRKKAVKKTMFFLPLIILVFLFMLYPTLNLVRISFSNSNQLTADVSGWSLSNYIHLFQHTDFHTTVYATFLFVFFSVVFQMLLGFIVAKLIISGEKRNLFGVIMVRTSVLIGWVIPGVVVGIVWNLFLTESATGIFNYWIQIFLGNKIPFLSNPNWALVSVIIANIWRGTAASMIMQYAGLKVIPNELHEAAMIDGASFLQEIVYVTIPAMKPVLYTNLVLITIKTVNTFDSIIALTGGGPGRSTEVLALSAYFKVFENFNLGGGAAIAVMLLVFNLILTFVYSKLLGNKEEGQTI